MVDDLVEDTSIILGGYNGYPFVLRKYDFKTVSLVREKLRNGIKSEEISKQLKIPDKHIVLMGIGMINIIHHVNGKVYFSKNPIPDIINQEKSE